MRGGLSILFLLSVCAILLPTSLFCQNVEQRFKFPNSEVYIRLVRSQKLQYSIMKGSQVLQTVTFDNFNTANNFIQNNNGSFTLSSSDSNILFELLPNSNQVTHLRVSRNFVARSQSPKDCLDLDIGRTHWYGGPEDFQQYWPVERLSFSNYSYVTNYNRNAAIAERYWLNSRGVFLYVEDQTPLFIDQNSPGYENKLCFSAQSALPYSSATKSATFRYHIAVAKNSKEAHMYAVKNILGIPTGHPDERMVQHPIWSTWEMDKHETNDSIVREIAQKIKDNNFKKSQFEINDDWEDCYGALTFRKSKFPNIKKLTDHLKSEGFRVTLWIHPFINHDCAATYAEALSKGFLVLNRQGNPETDWWNSVPQDAMHIDFSKPAAVKWFSKRLHRLIEEDGIDSFEFAAGESNWVPSDPVLQGPEDFHPSTITRDYIKAVAKFGPSVVVRSGQGTQNLPIFVRMRDKTPSWDWNSGLVTFITTLLQLNMNGYPFVRPDTIGGIGYDSIRPTKEVFIRWLQANVFMPSLQFSFYPWEFDAETIQISQKFCDLHSQYTPQIMERFKLATETGEPVNPPLWWVDPEDIVAQGIYDQFLLGDSIIAAPVIKPNAVKRDIYLPRGTWKDGNNGKVHQGPHWIMEYPAPLDVLPYFVKQN